MCTKSSILLYYLRFPSSRAFRYFTYTVLFVAVGYTLSGLLSFAYNCTPVARSWDRTISGTCIDVTTSMLVRAVLNVATDLCILLQPIWLLWPLRLSAVRKTGVALVLMAGGL